MRASIYMNDRTYTSFSLTKESKNDLIDVPHLLDPVKYKLFDQDEIEFNEDGSVIHLIHSPVRQHSCISGVLILATKKTFGQTDLTVAQKMRPCTDLRILNKVTKAVTVTYTQRTRNN